MPKPDLPMGGYPQYSAAFKAEIFHATRGTNESLGTYNHNCMYVHFVVPQLVGSQRCWFSDHGRPTLRCMPEQATYSILNHIPPQTGERGGGIWVALLIAWIVPRCFV